jgi:transglutaminase-like putative cysteine protease
MQIAIRYLTTFTYDTEVSESHNALRACPAETDHQRLQSYVVEVDPDALIVSHQDYWGTRVDSFGIVGRHTRLTIAADAVVETATPAAPTADSVWPLAEGADDRSEYLTPTPHVAWDGTVAAFAADAVAGASTLLEAVTQVQRAVGDLLEYETGATEVGTSVAKMFEQRRGVCQDYAHVALAAYRSLGVPARYVSGYLYAIDSASGEQPEDEDEIEVSTHAWVEVAMPGFGWWALDPTNQLLAGERHVKIGHGRDYEDVMPLRGVYHGDAESGGLEVAVKMSRSNLARHHITARPAFVPQPHDHHHQQQ